MVYLKCRQQTRGECSIAKGLTKSFKKALWIYHINSGSCNGCDIEIIASLCPRYDIERFGIKLVGSPRHADVLLITGPVSRQMVDKVKRTYAQIPDPKVVICVGNCGNTGDVFYESYNLVGPVDKILPSRCIRGGMSSQAREHHPWDCKSMGKTRNTRGISMTTTPVTPEAVLGSFQTRFPRGITQSRIERRTGGTLKTEFVHVWFHVGTDFFKEAVKHLFTFEQYPHFAVASGYDLGETIELVYHFSLFHGERGREMSLNMTVALPKDNPVIDTITDLIPGALISEQEKQEMLGVIIRGIPKDARVFVADDIPKGIFPWRRDEAGPAKFVRNLHEGEQ